jgi:ribonucleoside-diphosphate reductase beta chain
LLPLALGVIGEIFEAYETLPFGLTQEEFVGYAIDQFQKRLAWLERARSTPFVELMEIES